MLIYPQLTTGALCQYPAIKRRRARTVVNKAADGSRIAYADAAGETMEWQLAYIGLTDEEVAALQAFHAETEGSLNGFTFVDPTANLLAWSEELSNAAWAAGPLLTRSAGVANPLGGTAAWDIHNGGAGPQSLTQTLNAPAGYRYCFSVYVRSAESAAISLLVGANRVTQQAGPLWKRMALARSGDAAADSILFGIELPAGASVQVFGPQVEAQGSASKYQTSTTGGVFENARFRDDAFRFTTTGFNRHSAKVNILYANHL
jgi:hypothetical protein